GTDVGQRARCAGRHHAGREPPAGASRRTTDADAGSAACGALPRRHGRVCRRAGIHLARETADRCRRRPQWRIYPGGGTQPDSPAAGGCGEIAGGQVSEKNKVVWSEGLFLRPQHLQQQERYFERYVEGRAGGLLRHGWGFLELEVDRDLLAIGKLSLRTARGVFPDGTPFNMPADDALPLALELPAQTRDRIAYLALRVRRDGAVEISRKEGSGGMTRYALREWEARDATRETSERVPLEVATLQPRIVLQGEAFDDLTRLPVAMVREVRNDRSVLLDEGFMPTALDVGACAPLRQFLGELLGMVKQRADVLSAVVTATGRGGAAEFGEFLRLLTMNRYEPRLLHYSRVQPLHPEELYGLLLELAGELATISSSSRRLAPHPPYRQDN